MRTKARKDKRIIELTTKKIYKDVREICDELLISHRTLMGHLYGETYKVSGMYTFQYYEDYIQGLEKPTPKDKKDKYVYRERSPRRIAYQKEYYQKHRKKYNEAAKQSYYKNHTLRIKTLEEEIARLRKEIEILERQKNNRD